MLSAVAPAETPPPRSLHSLPSALQLGFHLLESVLLGFKGSSFTHWEQETELGLGLQPENILQSLSPLSGPLKVQAFPLKFPDLPPQAFLYFWHHSLSYLVVVPLRL